LKYFYKTLKGYFMNIKFYIFSICIGLSLLSPSIWTGCKRCQLAPVITKKAHTAKKKTHRKRQKISQKVNTTSAQK